MSDDEDLGKPVYGVGRIGSANNGDVVMFGLRSRDGSEHRFHCYARELSGIIAGLKAAVQSTGNQDDPGRCIDGVTRGGPYPPGEYIAVEFHFADGSYELFHMHHGTLPVVMEFLSRFGAAAEAERQGSGVDQIQAGQSRLVAGTPTVGISEGGLIMTQFPLAEGYPTLLAMSAEQASALLQGLSEALSGSRTSLRRQ